MIRFAGNMNSKGFIKYTNKLLAIISLSSVMVLSGINVKADDTLKTAGAFSSMGSSIGLNLTGSAVSCMSKAGVFAVLEDYNIKTVNSEEKIAEYVNAFDNVAIAKVHDYVNVRKHLGQDSSIVGKLYNESMGTILKEKKGWYKIKSGNVTGWVKKNYVVTGQNARNLAKKVGIRVANVKVDSLRVRKAPNANSGILTLVPEGESLNILKEGDNWLKIQIDDDLKGWIAKDYVDISTKFKKAETYDEEAIRRQMEEAQRVITVENNRVIRPTYRVNRSAKSNNSKSSSHSRSASSNYVPSTGYGKGADVVNYALQFVGNRYVYGGTSLTHGTDCSGFTKGVYNKFGVSLPRTSSQQRGAGQLVCRGWDPSKAKAGDIVCYPGHVAIYMGGGKIVHASDPRSGIKVSSKVNYRSVTCVRRIFK